MALLKINIAKNVKYLQSISKEYDNEMQSGSLFLVVYLVSAGEHYLCLFSIRAHWLNGWVNYRMNMSSVSTQVGWHKKGTAQVPGQLISLFINKNNWTDLFSTSFIVQTDGVCLVNFL